MPAVTSIDCPPVAGPSGSRERSPGDPHPASASDAVPDGPKKTPPISSSLLQDALRLVESPSTPGDPLGELQIVGVTGNGDGGPVQKHDSGDGGSAGMCNEGESEDEEEEWEDWEDVGGGAALEAPVDDLRIEIDEHGACGASQAPSHCGARTRGD